VSAIEVEQPGRWRDAVAIGVAFLAASLISRLTGGRKLDAERLDAAREHFISRCTISTRRATALVLDGAANLLLQLADAVDVVGAEVERPN
jgi:hypothetical protein